MQWLVEIKFAVVQPGDFLNHDEATKFIPAYLLKNSEDTIRPKSFNTKCSSWIGESGNSYIDCAFTLTYQKEFSDFSDLILWVDKVERNLVSYFEENKEIFRGAGFHRRYHSTYKLTQKRSFFSTKNVWVQVQHLHLFQTFSLFLLFTCEQ